jgi:uncharacterized membrane protein (DUF373 family)
MVSFRKIKKNYNLTTQDEEKVRSLYPIVKDSLNRIVQTLEERIRNTREQHIIEKLDAYPDLSEHHKEWLIKLFTGPYNKDFYWYLIKVGKKHASLKIEPHFVSVSMNTIRSILMDILSEEIEDKIQRTQLKESLNKMLDINLDIITSSYIEEELIQYSTALRIKSFLIRFAESFSSTMNLVLVLALILITLGVAGLFFYDVINIFAKNNISYGIISALGSLLILWILIELMNTEIEHLKGGRFNISVFIGVALVAFIRDLMIMTLKHEKIMVSYYLVAAIFVLGIVYWLVVKTEQRR